MIERYEKFLNKFDLILEYLFKKQSKYIKCKLGCSSCCRKGEYPISQLEFLYMTQGYINLPQNQKIIVQQNIMNLLLDKKDWQKKSHKKNERYEHTCPFLVNNLCAIYDYRGIICRTFGLCYYDDKGKYLRLPDCVNSGLNYAEYYDKKTKKLNIPYIPNANLRIDRIFESHLAQKNKLDCGEIRPLLDWFKES